MKDIINKLNKIYERFLCDNSREDAGAGDDTSEDGDYRHKEYLLALQKE